MDSGVDKELRRNGSELISRSDYYDLDTSIDVAFRSNLEVDEIRNVCLGQENESDESDSCDDATDEAFRKATIKKKITVDDAVEWVQSQLYEFHLANEEKEIHSEYEELRRHVEELTEKHQKLLEEEDDYDKDSDKEEYDVQHFMDDSQRTMDMQMKQHAEMNKIKELMKKYN